MHYICRLSFAIRRLPHIPAERIKLREVKRHSWVVCDIDDITGWLEASDLSQKTAGKRIQVDDRELERAVILITLLERARSAVKTAVGKVMGVKESCEHDKL
ncbi:hypothetical protein BKA65DRAFT_560308 [Rhexocercosporidium sp. MPI-PUGE-AT-0058]|nr:hypothetical protein BKA65DRAFT_560308 [Rhexocercosporidium sp. MPI-PUGE-AT-0058]